MPSASVQGSVDVIDHHHAGRHGGKDDANLRVPARCVQDFLNPRGGETDMLAKPCVRYQPLLNALLNPSLRYVQQVGQLILDEEPLAIVVGVSGRPSNLLRHDLELIVSYRLGGMGVCPASRRQAAVSSDRPRTPTDKV